MRRNASFAGCVVRAMRLAMVMLVASLVVGACAPPAPSTPELPTATPPSSSVVGSPMPATPPPTATPPADTVLCVPPTLPPSSPFGGDPCPAAIAAVRAVVEPTGFTIGRIVLEPDRFSCGAYWPGVESPIVCYGPFILPGTAMHGWVSFVGSNEVAAVEVRRPYPAPDQSPSPSAQWTASIVALAVPPAGWVMP